MLVLVQRHAWPLLAGLAYAATALTISAWAAESYTAGQWVRVLAWLSAFCALFLEVLRSLRRSPAARRGWCAARCGARRCSTTCRPWR